MTAWSLTWLWQGLALTLGVSVTLRILPRLNGATRYWIWWLTLAALPALGSWSSSGSGGSAIIPTYLFVIPAAPNPLIAIVVGVWIAIALVSLVRVLPGIHAVFQLRDRCTAFPRDVEAQLPLWLDAQAEGGMRRPARLMLCEAVRGATVLGFYRPYIALPPSLLKALTRDELDQVVLHEHAHVQRRDDWMRLAQTLFQSVLWIHPATALIGRRLDLEREIACDEWVVARTGLPKAYARCLARAADVRGRIRRQTSLGPALFTRKRDLVHRVNRLLASRGRTRSHVSVISAFAAACVLAMVAVQLRAVPLVGELAEVAPAVAVGMPPLVEAPVVNIRTSEAVTVRLKPDTTYFALDAPHAAPHAAADAPVRHDAPIPRDALIQGDAPIAPHAPVAPGSMTAVIPARSFDGHYTVAALPLAPSDYRAPWETARAVGTEIGASARKTTVGIANVFTRAGVSLARTF